MLHEPSERSAAASKLIPHAWGTDLQTDGYSGYEALGERKGLASLSC